MSDKPTYEELKRRVQELARALKEQKGGDDAPSGQEQFISMLVDYSSDILVFIDRDGVQRFISSSAEKITGYTVEELQGPFADIIHPEDLPHVQAGFDKVLEHPEAVVTVHYRHKHKDGGYRHFETVGRNFLDDPLVRGIVANVRDITDRVSSEENQKALERQLQIAQKMEAVGTLAGGIAHDFNNLLAGIQGRADLMLMDKEADHADVIHLKEIEAYIRNASELTGQLLAIAKGGKYEAKPTDLNELIREASRMFSRTRKEITIHETYGAGLWPVEVDRGQIDQVLLNLYVNAWHAMGEGGDLYVETKNVVVDEDWTPHPELEPGRYVTFSVRDTGTGMDDAIMEKIFDPFFTTKEMGRGTGLGLASAYGIIRNHDGFIHVESRKDHGSRFTVYLPASQREVVEETQSSGALLTGSETILFVDDEDMLSQVAEDLLGRLGYRVLIARTGKEAIEIYQKNKDRIHLVLLDMIMPGMSGGETYDRLKAIDPDVKTLLCSGYSMDGQACAILERGCDGFIQKPFKTRELSRKLREILDQE